MAMSSFHDFRRRVRVPGTDATFLRVERSMPGSSIEVRYLEVEPTRRADAPRAATPSRSFGLFGLAANRA